MGALPRTPSAPLVQRPVSLAKGGGRRVEPTRSEPASACSLLLVCKRVCHAGNGERSPHSPNRPAHVEVDNGARVAVKNNAVRRRVALARAIGQLVADVVERSSPQQIAPGADLHSPLHRGGGRSDSGGSSSTATPGRRSEHPGAWARRHARRQDPFAGWPSFASPDPRRPTPPTEAALDLAAPAP